MSSKLKRLTKRERKQQRFGFTTTHPVTQQDATRVMQQAVVVMPVDQPEWTPFQELKVEAEARQELRRFVDTDGRDERIYRNSRYTVIAREVPFGGEEVTHLSIRRNDRLAVHDWRDLQRLKNELCGPTREAFEIYPSEHRLVDTSNQYHLYVLPPDKLIPIGFGNRCVAEGSYQGSVQRPFLDDNRPPDLVTDPESLIEAEQTKRVAVGS